MKRRELPFALALALLLAPGVRERPAWAQKEVLDNIILLGPAETLNLPGVNRVVERPEEKTPPSITESLIEDQPYHRPLSTRFNPEDAYMMESGTSQVGGPPGAVSSGERISPLGDWQALLGRPRGLPKTRSRPLPGGPVPEGPGAEVVTHIAGTADLDDPGPANGLTLEAAVGRLIRDNGELRMKSYEISQAQADILTAGLRGNPIIFWDAAGTPYGRFSNQPGTRDFPIVITYLLDFTGRRVARVRVAQAARRVLEARYQDEVRRKVDELQMTFVDVLAARAALRAARSGAAEIDALRRRAKSTDDAGSDDSALAVEGNLYAMAIEDAEERLRQSRTSLASLLDLPCDAADRIEPYGTLRDHGPPPPPAEVLIPVALACRPDLVAQRLSVGRAQALEKMEESRRIRDTYILYEPWDYEVGQTNQGQKGVNTWGVALFAPLPIFDRNQGNIQRARLEIAKMNSGVGVAERQAVDEVKKALGDYHATLRSVERLDRQILPAIRRKRDTALRRLRSGQIGPGDYLDARREYDAVVRHHREAVIRHRRTMLRLNTAVGSRVLP